MMLHVLCIVQLNIRCKNYYLEDLYCIEHLPHFHFSRQYNLQLLRENTLVIYNSAFILQYPTAFGIRHMGLKYLRLYQYEGWLRTAYEGCGVRISE